MSLLTPAEMGTTYGGTGTYDSSLLQLAIDLAEFDIEDVLGIHLSPTSDEEDYIWPTDTGLIDLKWGNVTSIDSVLSQHSLNCDCEWTTDTECGVIIDAEHGIIKVVNCNSSSNCKCSSFPYAERAVVTYTSGYTSVETNSTTSLGKALRMAIALQARHWAKVLTDADNYQGDYKVGSWSSMDYSEKREYRKVENALNPLGANPLSEQAYMIISKLRPYTAIFIRGRGRT